jgi:hypothetical protein
MLMHKNHRNNGYQRWRSSVWIFIVLIGGMLFQHLHGMVEDNRVFAEFPHNYSRTWDRPSALFFDGLIMVGHEAFHQDEERTESILGIFGPYDENKIADALVAIGQPDPFDLFPTLARFRNQNIEWRMEGKLQTQGAAFQWDQHLWRYLWMGGSFFFMHLYSRTAFELSPVFIASNAISIDDQQRLDELRRLMNKQLGLNASVFNTTGFSDIDFYLRVGNIWDYLCRFKRIDAGIKFGAMFPTGLRRVIKNPASFPFGGDGHWGIYSAIDAEFELKEDWKAGLHARVNKRFAKTKEERMPVVGGEQALTRKENDHTQIVSEQQLWGAVVGPARIDPGVTFIVSPYGRLENIREGFGIQIGYTIVHHMKDSWKDERLIQVPITNLEANRDKSQWTTEFVTVDAFFDCTQILGSHRAVPIVSFKWDVPIKFFAAEGAVKTNRIMLGLQLNF